ncbi:lysozyme [Methylobacter sp. BlB1]|uniref:lysozyme n=1 Tax=Methylobacter sp. BlB1 TaxID=2785914 RepID=UPI0018945343|nr:lysozyme [Methylobacter sp. BlB1]
MVNENMRISTVGLLALRQREGVALRYYNDVANNCTFGIGGLAHMGPCTDEELRRPVNEQQVNAQLAHHVQTAEQTVRRRVTQQQLSQEQYDALVSFTFNVGAGGARQTLDAANRGANNDVINHMNQNIYIHPRDSAGRRQRAIRSQGLVNRRREESAPFSGQ